MCSIYRHGEKWDNFRAQVQHVMLQPSTARKYIMPLNEIANDFMDRYVKKYIKPSTFRIFGYL